MQKYCKRWRCCKGGLLTVLYCTVLYCSHCTVAGWVVYSNLRNSHYRLSIIYAKLEDSDTYTCVSQVEIVCNITVDIVSTISL